MLQPQVQWPGMTMGWAPVPADVITPPVDVLENSEEIIYIFAIPGASAENVRVEARQQVLEIEGMPGQKQEDNRYTYLYRERPVGRYYRLISLPPEIDADRAEASFNSGLLEVKFPKTNRGQQVKVINVRTAKTTEEINNLQY